MSKIRRHECKSLKEFNKILRKYIKYFKNRNIRNEYWYDWIHYDAIGLDALKALIPYANKLVRKGDLNLLYIINEIIHNYNWSFYILKTKYYLRGVQIANDDYYYIYVSDDGDKVYNTCVGNFSDLYTNYGNCY